MTPAFSRTVRFGSESETSRFAAALAPALVPGDTLLLQGGLGAGKTHFARALIQARLAAVGLAEDVPSPTYTLVQVYSDRAAEIWHCDLYRLSGPDEVAELGLDEAFARAICLVEWPERLEDLRPSGALRVGLRMTDDPGVRFATFESADSTWQDRLAPLLADRVDG
ncbi:tRNA (adenosine(37)-N6)-threonylcarbamoyltransferase complex ATPase subunit type 1 TsaE [Psychromarinibacter sp. C21-152]|uniref:tRNA threonylcarbamoyladenosine biosynthesis protein TsaE n=1 Tax=Psychromarinibacter sediminicola TaxID=3033385 RepID=A0AAE3NSJ9_9RHOB|nr:tRNA (adenosine(37)-N6)-threonylcarbamoyltransferase complex ATPase subunit type 1 TsaE [Psychromarinibacter sediminicola]MDF0601302.1 tRNA (adenosine(37)-N6)-threonylcarbamoyltransferase complex ATPase subunit type 1 TsaE [Psychromarinibacter sediminicola]